MSRSFHPCPSFEALAQTPMIAQSSPTFQNDFHLASSSIPGSGRHTRIANERRVQVDGYTICQLSVQCAQNLQEVLTIAAGHSCEGWSHDCDVYMCVLPPSQALSLGIAVDVARRRTGAAGGSGITRPFPRFRLAEGPPRRLRGDKDEPRYKSLAARCDE